MCLRASIEALLVPSEPDLAELSNTECFKFFTCILSARVLMSRDASSCIKSAREWVPVSRHI